MTTSNFIQREILPIPDRKPVGLTTYEAKDPETKFPPITPLRPPKGAPKSSLSWVRLYRPRAEMLEGEWKFPEAQPVSDTKKISSARVA